MKEFLLKSKWKIIQLLLLLIIVLLAIAYINGRSVYQEKVKQLEEAKQVFGNKS